MLPQTNYNTDWLPHSIPSPPYLPLPAAISELYQPVGLQHLVLLWHLQEQRVRELQSLGQLQSQEGNDTHHAFQLHREETDPCSNCTCLSTQAQGKTAPEPHFIVWG